MIYPGGRQKARPADIIALAVRAGEWGGEVRARFGVEPEYLVRIPAIAITRFGALRSRVSRHRDHVIRRIAIGAKRRLSWGLV
jgi:hypothetical protein